VDKLAAQAASDPAAVCGKVQGTYFGEGNDQGDEKGKKWIHDGLLLHNDFPLYKRRVS
jgi:hypothetical protein